MVRGKESDELGDVPGGMDDRADRRVDRRADGQMDDGGLAEGSTDTYTVTVGAAEGYVGV